MSNIKEDEYILAQSPIVTINKLGKQVKLNLGLESNYYRYNGKIYGYVKNEQCKPIFRALVKVMTEDNNPVTYALTNREGKYIIENIREGKYNIFAIAPKKKLNERLGIVIKNGECINIDFLLKYDKAMNRGIIVGDLFSCKGSKPIYGAVLKLFSIGGCLQAITYTNEYGQFAFRDVGLGYYILRINALGYFNKNIYVCVTKCGQIIFKVIYMIENPSIANGTVSGVIMNNENEPINRADVILYKVIQINRFIKSNKLIPISYTKTNQSGVYLFINVPKGTYKIKANKMETINQKITEKTKNIWFSNLDNK